MDKWRVSDWMIIYFTQLCAILKKKGSFLRCPVLQRGAWGFHVPAQTLSCSLGFWFLYLPLHQKTQREINAEVLLCATDPLLSLCHCRQAPQWHSSGTAHEGSACYLSFQCRAVGFRSPCRHWPPPCCCLCVEGLQRQWLFFRFPCNCLSHKNYIRDTVQKS